MDDIELHFTGDRDLVIEQEIVVAVYGAADRVLERDDAVGRAPLGDRFEDFVEALARQRLGLRSGELQGGRLAVGAGFSLIRESHAQLLLFINARYTGRPCTTD